MAFSLWARAQAKWRAILVYTALQTVMRFVTTYIYHEAAASPGLRLFASVALAATSIYCLVQTTLLLTSDRDGDDSWPPVWS